MSVPFYDHAKLYARRKTEIDGAIARVLSSGRLDWGEEVPAFEAEFAAWVGAAHAVTVNSGTAAIKVALMALGVGVGDEVITVSNTDIASSSAIHHVGAKCVWVDVDPLTMTMDVAQAERAITPRTKAILPVDLYGHPADLRAICDLAKARGLVVVEDACLALGAAVDGRRIGTWADVTCFSFAPTKHLGSIGSGGACVTQSPDLAERMQMLSGYGQPRAWHRSIGKEGRPLNHLTEGLNERLDELQAAVLRAKLPDLDASLASRRAQAALYAEGFAGSAVTVPGVRPGVDHAWRNYVIRVEERDRVRERLTAAGIGTSMSYAPPMHLQPVYRGYGMGPGSLPVSEHAGDRLLNLPIGPHLEAGMVEEVVAAVRAAL
jgi:dTDP-3-amino-3,4,6-trideoxy-alpha-D-glucose transaminase